jgi:cytochrome P450
LLNLSYYSIKHYLEAFRLLFREGIFDTDGDHWAALRLLIQPSFTYNQMADLATFQNLIQDLIVLLPCDGTTVVDLQDLFFCYTIDLATDFSFGQLVGTLRLSKDLTSLKRSAMYKETLLYKPC